MVTYNTENVCSKKIDIEVEGDTIKSVEFYGGCSGSLLGISKLIVGMKINDVIKIFENNKCGNRITSCPDQLAKALKQIIGQ
ncbi:MAG: hypothetical protein K0Q49_2292 [Haloplasmataceae bacterium]|nr:hypothetical protein [Haloplasmataceae bacterium]